MLMPAAALIVIVLSALAIDAALVGMRRRELAQIADAAANDAATMAIDLDELRRSGEVVLDQALAREVAIAAVARRQLAGAVDIDVATTAATAASPASVSVTLRREVAYVIAGRGRGPVLLTVTAQAFTYDPLTDY